MIEKVDLRYENRRRQTLEVLFQLTKIDAAHTYKEFHVSLNQLKRSRTYHFFSTSLKRPISGFHMFSF